MSTELSIWLSPEARATLEGWVADRNSPQKWVWRARIVLMWADGAGVTAIVRATGKTKRTAYRWRDRYAARGIEGLEARCQPAEPQAAAFRRGDQACGGYDAASEAAGGHALVGAQARQGGWAQPVERAAHLGSAWAEAASDRRIQAVQ